MWGSGAVIVAVHKLQQQKLKVIKKNVFPDFDYQRKFSFFAATSFFGMKNNLVIIKMFFFFLVFFWLHWKLLYLWATCANCATILFAECDNRTTAPVTDSSHWTGSCPERLNLLLFQRPLSGATVSVSVTAVSWWHGRAPQKSQRRASTLRPHAVLQHYVCALSFGTLTSFWSKWWIHIGAHVPHLPSTYIVNDLISEDVIGFFWQLCTSGALISSDVTPISPQISVCPL